MHGPDDGRLTCHEFLAALHDRVAPRTYLEIGVNDGQSLTLSRTTSIGVDPAFRVTVPIRCDLDLVKATSDEFFARPDPIAHFRRSRRGSDMGSGDGVPGTTDQVRPVIDLAFIDGLHHFEFALRDFMNVEHHADWWTVIVIDDVLPRNTVEANRDRQTKQWAGDVFKLVPVLATHRPDLIVLPVDTSPTGVVLVIGADPASHVLRDRYDAIVAEWVVPDPQTVPSATLKREGAIDAHSLLESAVWPALVGGRDRGLPAERGTEIVRHSLAGRV